MAIVKDRKTGKEREVKNLRWLINHASEVKKIYIQKPDNPNWDCKIMAFTDTDKIFVTHFASYTACLNWLARKSLRRVSIINEINPKQSRTANFQA